MPVGDRREGDVRNRREVADQMAGELSIDRRVRRERSAGQHDLCIPVGRRTRDLLAADHAAGAALVVDDERLAERDSESLKPVIVRRLMVMTSSSRCDSNTSRRHAAAGNR